MSWTSTCGTCYLDSADCACVLDPETMHERAVLDAGIKGLEGWTEERKREHEIRSLRAVTVGMGARDEDFDPPSMTTWQRQLEAEAMRELTR